MVTCSDCGSEFEEATVAGPFARFAAAIRPEAMLCPECEDRLSRREELEEERLRQAATLERRRAMAGMPERLQRVSFLNLRDVPPNAIAAAREWAQGRRRGLVLSGKIGVGKTFIAAAAANEMLGRRQLQWCATSSLIIQVSAAFGDEDRAKAIRHLTGNGPLVLDDLDKVNPSPYVRQHLFAAIDNRIVADAPLLVTTNLDLRGVAARLGDEVASRLEGYCRIVTLMGADRRRLDYRTHNATRRF
jgi:DNA replication protein DnaC